VDPELGIGFAFARAPVAIEVEYKQTVGVGQGWTGTRGKQKRVGRIRDSGADVTETSDQSRGVSNAIGKRDVAA
jgi:hypothetical protein